MYFWRIVSAQCCECVTSNTWTNTVLHVPPPKTSVITYSYRAVMQSSFEIFFILTSVSSIALIINKIEIIQFSLIFIFSPTPKVTWKKIGSDFGPRVSFPEGGQKCSIENVDFIDEGEYSCEGNNNFGNTEKHTFTVKVESEFTGGLSSLHLKKGYITCICYSIVSSERLNRKYN